MQFDLTQDQELLRDTTRRFLEATVPLTTLRQRENETKGFSRSWWRQGAQLGWTSLLIPEELGGGSLDGQGLLDLVIVAEEMGRLVSPGPLTEVNVIAETLARVGTSEQVDAVLPGLLEGELLASWCLADRGTDRTASPLRADTAGDGFRLHGEASPVEVAVDADWFLVTAPAPSGPTQFLLPANTEGVAVTALDSIDLVRRFGRVTFHHVHLDKTAVVGTPGKAGETIERQTQVAVVIQTAETVGAAQRVFDFTLEYMFDRNSFGRPLASYQALKHRFADMKVWLEASHATASAAAVAVQHQTPDASELVSVAKSYIGDRVTELMQECVQMHGGMGVTWEHDLHLYLRRATLNRALYGTPEEHRERIAAVLNV
jgi:alkylation response protein AidB-like acyl-CoA dehydrogenase